MANPQTTEVLSHLNIEAWLTDTSCHLIPNGPVTTLGNLKYRLRWRSGSNGPLTAMCTVSLPGVPPLEDFTVSSHLMKAGQEKTQNAIAVPRVDYNGSTLSDWFITPRASEKGWIKLVVKKLFPKDNDESVVFRFNFPGGRARNARGPLPQRALSNGQKKRKREQATDEANEHRATMKKLAIQKINAAKRQLVGKMNGRAIQGIGVTLGCVSFPRTMHIPIVATCCPPSFDPFGDLDNDAAPWILLRQFQEVFAHSAQWRFVVGGFIGPPPALQRVVQDDGKRSPPVGDIFRG
ncbi:hypothetical protein B0H17DRAFT_1140911 [Mycena rosella]|uniref:Uncharacterized protein n=1 Tax=Mycena rosella TaxID=1033263 RepID=A0AAD7D0S6_MYCRO|nr:hypothetical protein B0H17DRAFT_1140911 [Mycena rosella]